MKAGSRILYIIGAITCVLGIIIGLITLGVGNWCIQNAQEVLNNMDQSQSPRPLTVDDVKNACQILVIVGGVFAGLCAVGVALAIVAFLGFKKGSTRNVPHIIMIIVGVIAANIFFLIGGILGLVGQKDEAEQPAE